MKWLCVAHSVELSSPELEQAQHGVLLYVCIHKDMMMKSAVTAMLSIN